MEPAYGQREYPTFGQAVFLLVLFIICQLAASAAVGLLASAVGKLVSGIALAIVNVIAFTVILQYVLRRRQLTIRVLIRPRVLRPALLTVVFIAATGAVASVFQVEAAIQHFLPVSENLQRLLSLMYDPKDPLGAIFTICIVAPVTEEVVFRGIILEGFLWNYSKIEAILFSSWLFAFAHLNPWQYASAFLLGLLQGFIYSRTRSVIPSILAHAVNNAWILIIVAAPVPLNATLSSYSWLLSLAGLGVVAVALVLLWRLTKQLAPDVRTWGTGT